MLNENIVHNYNDQFLYEVESGKEICIRKYIGAEDHVEVPAIIDNTPVTSIEYEAFKDCTLTSITIPDSIQNIYPNAFIGCMYLRGWDIDFNKVNCRNGAFYSPYMMGSYDLRYMEISLIAYQLLEHFGVDDITSEMYNIPLRDLCESAGTILDDIYKTFSLVTSFAEPYIHNLCDEDDEIGLYNEHFNKEWHTPIEFGNAIIEFIEKIR